MTLTIDLENNNISGRTTAKKIREKGLIQASIEHKEEERK